MTKKPESEMLIIGGFWKTPSVAEQPEVVIERWRILEVLEGPCAGERHIVGYNRYDFEGRVSTAIVSYDPETRKCVTRSGRVYVLTGRSGYDPDGDYVWRAWSRVNRVGAQVDVSGMYEGADLDDGSI
ncbi:hypothetical protein KP005_13925 [Geomonas nitrogeniifigens]|uniref:Uncharacterized protein n=1 Tax=Geomonas diazotrophica TaxID=2843197 RepID=A0ABX8JFX0_9BACT|nr:hypothetical protein [Geomonas nitrogeniifigens]QWV96464.1 hypothetical protein KP005_13925 [Geomonas nitrogeniifigens]